MRRVLLVAIVAALVTGGVVWFSTKSARVQADTEPGGGGAPAVRTPQLPIAQVVLFSSGVGYFQREGVVEDNARIDLSFPVTDINDLLKSMVLRDLDGGHISTVSYESNAPVERTLKSFAINLTGNPSLAGILNQARGEKIEAVTQQGTVAGAVVGIEKQQVVAGKNTAEAELLNLWCADGMRSLKLSEVQRLRFLNPILDGEFKKALETLAQSHDTQKKSVSINCTGAGKREVARRLRDREPHLENKLPPGAGKRQAIPARLGHRREHHRRRLEGCPHGPGVRPAHLVPDGPVPAALRAATRGRAGTVRFAATTDIQRRPDPRR